MADLGIELVVKRNDFYRNNYRKVLGLLLLNILVIGALSYFIYYIQSNEPGPFYFAVSDKGKIISDYPINSPGRYRDTSKLLAWAEDAATNAFTINFIQYRQQIQTAQEYFTNYGYKQFQGALESSNILNTILDQNLYLIPIITAPATLEGQGDSSQGWGWRVKVPMLLVFQNSSESLTQPIDLTLTILRRSSLQTKYGLGIVQVITTQQ